MAESKTTRDGRALRTTIHEARRLRAKGKVKESKDTIGALDKGRELGERRVQQRVKALTDVLFQTGKWTATAQVLESFLRRGEVRELRPDQAASSAKETRAMELMIESAKVFISECLTRHPGRRTLQDTNAFWVILAALVPDQVFDQKLGATMGRLLGVNYRAIRDGLAKRKETEDAAEGWRFVTTSKHFDSVEVETARRWLHVDGTTEDNANKRLYRVFHTSVGDDGKHVVEYEEHWRRYFKGPIKELHQEFLKSDDFLQQQAKHHAARVKNPRRRARIKKAVVKIADGMVNAGKLNADAKDAWIAEETARRVDNPEPLTIGLKSFRKAICPCMHHRAESQCECQLCSYITYNLRVYHNLRRRAHADQAKARKAPASPDEHTSEVQCEACPFDCGNPDCDGRRATESVGRLVRYLLCEPEAVPGYEDGFTSNKTACIHRGLRADSGACCGIEKSLPLCLTEDTSNRVTFNRWVPMERGKNKETGSPFVSAEFIPVKATAGEFIREFREQLAQFIKHWHELRWTKHHWKTIVRLRKKDANWQTKVATVNADYASQVCAHTCLCVHVCACVHARDACRVLRADRTNATRMHTQQHPAAHQQLRHRRGGRRLHGQDEVPEGRASRCCQAARARVPVHVPLLVQGRRPRVQPDDGGHSESPQVRQVHPRRVVPRGQAFSARGRAREDARGYWG